MKDELFSYLQSEGLQPRIDEDGDIAFKYQMLNFCFLIDEDDKQFFRLAMPNIFGIDENNRIEVLEACNAVTRGIKVAKAIAYEKSVWIMCEQLIDTTPNYADIVPRSLKIAIDARARFIEEISKS